MSIPHSPFTMAISDLGAQHGKTLSLQQLQVWDESPGGHGASQLYLCVDESEEMTRGNFFILRLKMGEVTKAPGSPFTNGD